MKPKERVAAAFALGEVDKTPLHHIGFSSEIASALLGREAYVGGGIQKWREATALWEGADAHAEFMERSFRDAMAVARAVENDVIRSEYWRAPTKPTKRIDEYTFLYEYGPEEEWSVLRYDGASEQCNVSPYRPRAMPTWEEIEARVAAAESATAEYRPTEDDYAASLRGKREMGDEYAIKVGACGIWLPNNTEGFMTLMQRPDLAIRQLELSVARAAPEASFLAGHGFPYLFGGNDFASNEGPMFSPRHFHELVLPRLRRIAEVCHEHGCKFLFASDGNLWPVAEDLFGNSGVDGYFEIDGRAGMDLAQLRERFPRLILIGNISSHTIHLGTKDEVKAETLRCMKQAKECKGVIAGVSNYFVPGTPVENVETMLRVISDNR